MNIRRIKALVKRELVSYFASPVAYVVLAMFALLTGYFFYVRLQLYTFLSLQFMRYQGEIPSLNTGNFIIQPLYANLGVILLLLMPMITMKSYAEEKRNGTKELIMTSPVTLTEIVLGKFISACLVYAAMLALTLSVPVILHVYASADSGILLTAYMGMIFLGAVMISVGMFASSLTENQIVAAVLTFGILLLFWAIGWVSHGVSPAVSSFLGYVSLVDQHFQNLLKGILDTRDIVYYLSFIFFFLFLTHRVLESERWR